MQNGNEADVAAQTQKLLRPFRALPPEHQVAKIAEVLAWLDSIHTPATPVSYRERASVVLGFVEHWET